MGWETDVISDEASPEGAGGTGVAECIIGGDGLLLECCFLVVVLGCQVVLGGGRRLLLLMVFGMNHWAVGVDDGVIVVNAMIGLVLKNVLLGILDSLVMWSRLTRLGDGSIIICSNGNNGIGFGLIQIDTSRLGRSGTTVSGTSIGVFPLFILWKLFILLVRGGGGGLADWILKCLLLFLLLYLLLLLLLHLTDDSAPGKSLNERFQPLTFRFQSGMNGGWIRIRM